MISINFIAVLVAAVVAFIIGFLFHGPIGGKLWMKLANVVPTGNEKLSDMVPQMIGNLFTNFVTALGLSVMFTIVSSSSAVNISGVWGGVLCGVFVWIFFLVTSSAIEVIWMGRKTGLWLYESGWLLIAMGAMGAIVAVWR